MNRQKSSGRFRFAGAAALLSLLFFLVPALREGNATLYLLAAAVPCVLVLGCTLLARFFSLDRMLIAVSLYLCACGVAVLAPDAPEEALAQGMRCCAGLLALVIGGMLIRSLTPSLLTASCAGFLGLLVLSAPLFSPQLDLPLSEAGLALVLLSVAALLSRGTLPALLPAAAALALLLIRRQTALAVLWGLALLLLVYAADGRLIIVLPVFAAVLCSVGGVPGFSPGTLPAPDPSSLQALASAGLAGTETLPPELAAGSASLFPPLTGRYGLIFAGFTGLLYLPLALRGTFIASAARTRFHALLSMGVSLMLGLKTLLALLPLFGVLPLEETALPLLTDSLPSLCAWMFLLGLQCGISGRNEADLAEDAHLAMLEK